MKLGGNKYLGTRTGHRYRNRPADKERLEDWSAAQVCDLRWEIEMEEQTPFDVFPETIEIV